MPFVTDVGGHARYVPPSQRQSSVLTPTQPAKPRGAVSKPDFSKPPFQGASQQLAGGAATERHLAQLEAESTGYSVAGGVIVKGGVFGAERSFGTAEQAYQYAKDRGGLKGTEQFQAASFRLKGREYAFGWYPISQLKEKTAKPELTPKVTKYEAVSNEPIPARDSIQRWGGGAWGAWTQTGGEFKTPSGTIYASEGSRFYDESLDTTYFGTREGLAVVKGKVDLLPPKTDARRFDVASTRALYQRQAHEALVSQSRVPNPVVSAETFVVETPQYSVVGERGEGKGAVVTRFETGKGGFSYPLFVPAKASYSSTLFDVRSVGGYLGGKPPWYEPPKTIYSVEGFSGYTLKTESKEEAEYFAKGVELRKLREDQPWLYELRSLARYQFGQENVSILKGWNEKDVAGSFVAGGVEGLTTLAQDISIVAGYELGRFGKWGEVAPYMTSKTDWGASMRGKTFSAGVFVASLAVPAISAMKGGAVSALTSKIPFVSGAAKFVGKLPPVQWLSKGVSAYSKFYAQHPIISGGATFGAVGGGLYAGVTALKGEQFVPARFAGAVGGGSFVGAVHGALLSKITQGVAIREAKAEVLKRMKLEGRPKSVTLSRGEPQEVMRGEVGRWGKEGDFIPYYRVSGVKTSATAETSGFGFKVRLKTTGRTDFGRFYGAEGGTPDVFQFTRGLSRYTREFVAGKYSTVAGGAKVGLTEGAIVISPEQLSLGSGVLKYERWLRMTRGGTVTSDTIYSGSGTTKGRGYFETSSGEKVWFDVEYPFKRAGSVRETQVRGLYETEGWTRSYYFNKQGKLVFVQSPDKAIITDLGTERALYDVTYPKATTQTRYRFDVTSYTPDFSFKPEVLKNLVNTYGSLPFERSVGFGQATLRLMPEPSFASLSDAPLGWFDVGAQQAGKTVFTTSPSTQVSAGSGGARSSALQVSTPRYASPVNVMQASVDVNLPAIQRAATRAVGAYYYSQSSFAGAIPTSVSVSPSLQTQKTSISTSSTYSPASVSIQTQVSPYSPRLFSGAGFKVTTSQRLGERAGERAAVRVGSRVGLRLEPRLTSKIGERVGVRVETRVSARTAQRAATRESLRDLTRSVTRSVERSSVRSALRATTRSAQRQVQRESQRFVDRPSFDFSTSSGKTYYGTDFPSLSSSKKKRFWRRKRGLLGKKKKKVRELRPWADLLSKTRTEAFTLKPSKSPSARVARKFWRKSGGLFVPTAEMLRGKVKKRRWI